MNPKIDEAALAEVAAVGASPPPLTRLRAATEHAATHVPGAQIILFGSAARGEFTPESDFDFLAVTKEPPPGEGEIPARLEHPRTGDKIHVVPAGAATIHKLRWTVGSVYRDAMIRGRTLCVQDAKPAVMTERDPGGRIDPMVKKKLEDLSEAAAYASQARDWMHGAKFYETMAEPRWAMVCKHMQEAAERALQSLHIAHRQEIGHKHDLIRDWNKAEALGEKIPTEKNQKLLHELNKYASEEGYGTPIRMNPKKLAAGTGKMTEALIQYAEKRVPELLKIHEREKRNAAASHENQTRLSAKVAKEHAQTRVPALVAERKQKLAQTRAEERDDNDTPIRPSAKAAARTAEKTTKNRTGHGKSR